MRTLISVLAVMLASNVSAATYTYDNLNRLATVTYGADKVVTYTYDKAGNITRIRKSANIPNVTNAACGAANGVIATTKPIANLCTSGIPTSVSGSGPWNWSCESSNGGTAANCLASIGVPLNLTFAGTGAGTINGDMSCYSADSCPPAMFPYGTAISLIPTPNTASIFVGWSGDCTNTTGNCTLAMTNAKAIIATFEAAPKLKVGANSFITLQAAYDDTATTSGSIIKLLEGVHTGTLIAGRGITVNIEGGCNATYSGISTETTIQGPMKLQAGTVRVKGVKVK